MKVKLQEEKTYTIANGDKIAHGMWLSETWNGFKRYIDHTGNSLILNGDVVVDGNADILQALGIQRGQYTPAFSKFMLEPGEAYAGIVLKEDGTPDYHLILVAGELVDASWDEAMAWAKPIGHQLPTRREQSLLFANAKRHFKDRAYWSCEQHAGNSLLAWSQGFNYCGQYGWSKTNKLCARVVRKLPI